MTTVATGAEQRVADLLHDLIGAQADVAGAYSMGHVGDMRRHQEVRNRIRDEILDEVRALESELAEAKRDGENWRWMKENAGRWSLAFVAFSGKWSCEGPDDALLDERFNTADEAIDAARATQGAERAP